MNDRDVYKAEWCGHEPEECLTYFFLFRRDLHHLVDSVCSASRLVITTERVHVDSREYEEAVKWNRIMSANTCRHQERSGEPSPKDDS